MFIKKLHLGHDGLIHFVLSRILWLYKFPPKALFFAFFCFLLFFVLFCFFWCSEIYWKNCIRDNMVWHILSFQGSYINVHLTLVYFFVPKKQTQIKIKYGLKHIVLPRIFCYLKYFWKFFNQGQYMWIHIVHLVNFGQSLSKSHMLRSMLIFTMFLANSDQETIRTIRFDPYFP